MPLFFVLVLVLVMPSRGLYTVEVDRVGVDGMNVLFDSYHHPETSDFGINNGKSFHYGTAHTHTRARAHTAKIRLFRSSSLPSQPHIHCSLVR